MTAKEYLGQAYGLDQRITSKLEQLSQLRALAQKVTASYEGEPVSHTRNVSVLEDAVIRLMEAEQGLNISVDALVALKLEISACIGTLENTDAKLILERRYLCFQSWGQIASELGLSKRWVQTVHSRALETLDATLREKLEGIHGGAGTDEGRKDAFS